MAIKIDEREHFGTAVLVVMGRIALTECHGDLKDAVRGLIERGRKQIVLDLEAVPFVDTSGLGELVSSYASVQRLGGTLRLTNVNQRVADALESTGLTSILELIELPRSSASTQPVNMR